MENNLTTLGTICRKRREEMGIKSQDVARLLGVCRSAYSRIENGKIRPSYSQCEKLSQMLNIPMHVLLSQAKIIPLDLENIFCQAYFLAGERIKTDILSIIRKEKERLARYQ